MDTAKDVRKLKGKGKSKVKTHTHTNYFIWDLQTLLCAKKINIKVNHRGWFKKVPISALGDKWNNKFDQKPTGCPKRGHLDSKRKI